LEFIFVVRFDWRHLSYPRLGFLALHSVFKPLPRNNP
jgi:hypothetical protein